MTVKPELPEVTMSPENIKEVFSGDSEIDEMARLVCPDLALCLLDHLGGLDIKVPKKMHSNHPIAEAIGLDRAVRLTEYIPNEYLFIPMRHPALTAKKHLQIEAMLLDGVTRNDIARRLGITARHLRRIMSKMGWSWKFPARPRRRKSSLPPESVFNGGLTGGSASFATLPPSEHPNGPQRPVQTKYGIYAPQS